LKTTANQTYIEENMPQSICKCLLEFWTRYEHWLRPSLQWK